MKTTILRALTDYFQRQGLNYQHDEERGWVAVVGSSEKGCWHSVLRVDDDAAVLLTVSYFPVAMPPRLRARCVALLAQMNSGLMVGCWDIEAESGMIRYKTAVPLVDGKLHDATIEWMLGCHHAVMEAFYWQILETTFGGGDESPVAGAREVPKATLRCTWN